MVSDSGSIRVIFRNRWVQRGLTAVLLGLAAVVAFAQGGVLPVAFGALVGMVAAVGLSRYIRDRGG